MQEKGIFPIVMPKWGLSMTEGTVVEWSVEEGDTIAKNQELLEIETSKITNVFESTKVGVLRRKVALTDETLPVGALLAIIADEGVADADIDAFVKDFQDNFVPPDADAEGGASPVSEIQIDGQRISYLVANKDGSGIPALMIHGFGGNANNWMMNLDAIAEKRPVYVPDLLGHGASSKDVGDGSPLKLVQSLKGFLDSLGIERVHLVGHSLGGALAILLASDLKGKVASLTCIAPAGLSEKVNPEFLEQYLTAERRRPVKAVMQMLVKDAGLVSGDMVEDFQKYKRLEGSVEAMKKIAAQAMPEGRQSADLRETFSGLDCGKLVIWGKHDRIIDASAAENLKGDASVEILEEAGHLPQLECADQVNALCVAHMAKAG